MRGVIVVMLLLRAGSAIAQSSDNKALAEQLFNQGRELAKADKWAEACPKFEASLRYDPALGTKLNLATCYEKVGKIASAWGLYRDAAELAAKAGDPKRHEYAVTQATALEPRLPKLTINAPSPQIAGLAIVRDGVPVEPGAIGTALYVDPGKHVVVASAPGYTSLTQEVTVAEGKAETVTIPALVAAPKEVEPLDDPRYTGSSDDPRPRKRRMIALGVGGAGVVVLGVGLVFGAKASSSLDAAKTLCGDDLVCRNDADFDRGKQLISDARSQATLSTVFAIVGGASIAAGAVIWFTAPKARSTETARIVPAVSKDSVGIALSGGF